MTTEEKAKEWIKKQPHCVGYMGKCDEDLLGEKHSEECPMSKMPDSKVVSQ